MIRPPPAETRADRFSYATAIVLVALGVFLSTRLLLLFSNVSEFSRDPRSLLGAFGYGFLFDTTVALYVVGPVVLYSLVVSDKWFRSRKNQWILRALFCAVSAGLVFCAAAEFFFWQEFGARFNFIAVDYLIYTTEVLGNIRESYPMPLILPAIGLAALAITWIFYRTGWLTFTNAVETRFPRRALYATAWLALTTAGSFVLSNDRVPSFANSYNQELARNGIFSFVAAFRNNSLDYEAFYRTLEVPAAFKLAREDVQMPNQRFLDSEGLNIKRQITNGGSEKRFNVIQITVESLSGSFLEAFGHRENLTPNLNSLTKESLFFTRFYATGNRTDRGMEALTLSVPPTPGRSIVKRPNNENLFTVGSVFRERGYDTAFIYGGYGYFDNMNYFFGNNGYRVLDRAAVPRSEVTFANVWGACDEDLFRWTIKDADTNYKENKPFFKFVMTTSNHRPYTYPDGRIDIPSHTGRSGAVKYTDYAIGKFLAEAKTRPWFTNTIFVIVADHCASSAGKTELPVENYHIPLLIYAPGLITARHVDQLCSQIDYAPTLLSLLGWDYTSEFFGKDILAMKPEDERALIANYQKLGVMNRDTLLILKPQRKVSSFHLRSETEFVPNEPEDQFVARSIAYYQTAGYLFSHHRDHHLDGPMHASK